jgi:hypothetical protein
MKPFLIRTDSLQCIRHTALFPAGCYHVASLRSIRNPFSGWNLHFLRENEYVVRIDVVEALGPVALYTTETDCCTGSSHIRLTVQCKSVLRVLLISVCHVASVFGVERKC